MFCLVSRSNEEIKTEFKLLKISVCVLLKVRQIKTYVKDMAYRFKQCANAIVFKYFNEQCPNYLNKFFDIVIENNYQLRGSFQKLKCPFDKTNTGELALSYIVQHFGIKPWTHSSILKILIPSNII